MPEHFHLLVTPSAEVSLEKAVPFIKGGFFSHLLSSRGPYLHSESILLPTEIRAHIA